MRRSKDEERIEYLEAQEKKREVEDEAKKLFTKWMIIVCRTSTIAMLTVGTFLGNWIGNHSERTIRAVSVLLGYGDSK